MPNKGGATVLIDEAREAFADLLHGELSLAHMPGPSLAVGCFPDGFDCCRVDLGEQLYIEFVMLALARTMVSEPLPRTFRDGDEIVLQTARSDRGAWPRVRARPDGVLFALLPVSRKHGKRGDRPKTLEPPPLDEVVPHLVKFSKDTYRIIFTHQPDAAGSILRFPKFDWPRCPFDWAVVAAIVDGASEPEPITLPLSGAWLGAEEDEISPALVKALRPRLSGPKR